HPGRGRRREPAPADPPQLRRARPRAAGVGRDRARAHDPTPAPHRTGRRPRPSPPHAGRRGRRRRARPLLDPAARRAAHAQRTRHARTAGASPPQTIGWRTGPLLVASVSALPPWWFRPSVDHTFFLGRGWSPPSLGLALVALAALVGVLAGCWWDARRRRDQTA